MWSQNPSFRFEINNFSTKKDSVFSNTFVSNGCEWYVKVHPNGDALADGHLALFLFVENCPAGWKRSTRFYFVVLNKSGKELYKSPIGDKMLCTEDPSWGFGETMPVTKLQEEGVLEKDILIVEVYIESLVEVISETKKETVDINGFQVLASKLDDWLKSKLDELSLEKKKEEADASWVLLLEERVKKLEMDSMTTMLANLGKKICSPEELERRVKSLELMELGSKFNSLEEKLYHVYSARAMSDYACEVRGKEVEKRIKNLELMEIGVKMESLETKLDEVCLERKKSDDADESRVQQLEEHVKELEIMELGVKLESLNTKLEDSLELVKSQAQELEESVKDLVMMVSELKAELDKKKDKSSADGFLLVD